MRIPAAARRPASTVAKMTDPCTERAPLIYGCPALLRQITVLIWLLDQLSPRRVFDILKPAEGPEVCCSLVGAQVREPAAPRHVAPVQLLTGSAGQDRE